jgi:hypothetical protein
MKRKFILSEAEAMAGLVRHILVDVVETWRRLHELEQQSKTLQILRTSPDYTSRNKYYQVLHDTETVREDMARLRTEMSRLGVEILDIRNGVAAFPFRWSRNLKSQQVRKAYFLLKLSDDPSLGIRQWRFTGERTERRVPKHWNGQLSSPIIAEMAA